MTGSAVQLAFLLAALGLNIYVALDARATPVEVFRAVDRSRTLWMTLSLVGAFLSAIGVAIAVYYLLRVRPLLRPEIAAQGLGDRVSARTKLVQYGLPAMALAVAVVIGMASEARQ